jgi:small neutral amino acid transporter SnatA (MarC family)
VVGEALTGLWRVAEADPRLADLRAPLAARAECIAGLAIAAQATAADASTFAEPDRVAGAWFRGGETRMDDQQHALAALLRTQAIVDAGPPRAGDPEGEIPPAVLWFAALLAAYNPGRAALAVPRAGRSRRNVAGVAAVGGVLASAVAAVAAALSGPLLDAFDVSVPSMRLAAGAVGAIGGAVALVRRPPPAEPALRGWGATVVPVAVPAVLGPALLALALGGGADRGVWLVLGTGLVGTGLLAALSTGVGRSRAADRVLTWAGRITAAGLVLTSLFLVVSGVLDV